MEDTSLEKFIFYRFVKISYIVLLSSWLILLMTFAFRIYENKEVDYSKSKIECYNGKQIELCCDPFIYVPVYGELYKKEDYLVRKECHDGSRPISEHNYDLSIKYSYPKLTLLEVTLALILGVIEFLIAYIPLNIIRELLLYVVYAKPICWRWLWKIRIFS